MLGPHPTAPPRRGSTMPVWPALPGRSTPTQTHSKEGALPTHRSSGGNTYRNTALPKGSTLHTDPPRRSTLSTNPPRRGGIHTAPSRKGSTPMNPLRTWSNPPRVGATHTDSLHSGEGAPQHRTPPPYTHTQFHPGEGRQGQGGMLHWGYGRRRLLWPGRPQVLVKVRSCV